MPVAWFPIYPNTAPSEIVRYALDGLKAMYKEGYRYKKAGVSLSKITPQSALQPDLFGDFSVTAYEKQARLMCIVDAINRIYGRETLFFAIQGMTRRWKMRQSHLSSRFTTQWSELLSF